MEPGLPTGQATDGLCPAMKLEAGLTVVTFPCPPSLWPWLVATPSQNACVIPAETNLHGSLALTAAGESTQPLPILMWARIF